ncbi:hypothetical protein [Lentzea sp. NBRC 102530]|uniref:hypothetical protein n=1 Tax=Lentzea sp. NBRC 102530 TaxID=3032201 RepID=UPI0024A3CB1B|nr:hypothetical protein [Lentzea sp. NBRC 102530]GLY51468.1 hypothetical protein Lesp01_51240 [Lentzea sp. NBRC 102530]
MAAEVPPNVVKLSRSKRFRATVSALANQSGQDEQEVAARLITACAHIALALDDPSEQDWCRLLDALLLMAEHPAH